MHYYDCRKQFVPPDTGFSPVPYFLNCRAIELALKAHLLDQASLKHVKNKFGHNLVAAYNALPQKLKTLSSIEFQVLNAANDIYKDKGFEYFTLQHTFPGLAQLPDLTALDLVTFKLVAQ